MLAEELGEDGLIERLTSQLEQKGNVQVGPGDDCAVMDGGLLLKTDCVVEGIHYLPEEVAERVGWKAMARVVSDFVAMGGVPEALMVTLALAEGYQVEWLEGLYRGMQKCAERYDFSIVGGETSRLPKGMIISIAGTGRTIAGSAILRSGAQSGDVVFVTGCLGGSLEGWHLDFEPRLELMQWLIERYRPTAMMDISDGLGKDLPRLARASGLGFELDFSQVPCRKGATLEQALGDGEDYELLFTLAPEDADKLLRDRQWLEFSAGFTRVGAMSEFSGQTLTGGWEHF